jgi:hypothetical protein
MEYEEEIYRIKKQANSKIKKLKFIINQLELKNYNLELKQNSVESQKNSVKSRNVDLTKQVFDFKKRDAHFRRKLDEYEKCISMIKSYFNLDNIEEISNYIQKNIIEKKSDLEAKEKELEFKQMTIDIQPEIEFPKSLKNANRPKR